MDTSTLPVVAGSSSEARTAADLSDGRARTRRRPGPSAGTGPPGRAYQGVYRYWPVLLAVSIARPDSAFLPVTSVRM